MKLKLCYLLFICIFLSACEKDSKGETEAFETDCLVQEVVSYYTSRNYPQPDSRTKHVFSYDSQNRIKQIEQTPLGSNSADGQSIITYKYDSNGRVVERKLTNSTRGIEFTYTYEYNDKGQLLVMRHIGASKYEPAVETSRIEYIHGASNEPDSSVHYSMKPFHGDELYPMLSRKYTYSNGLLTRVKTYPVDSEFQWLPYEDDIRYNNNKAPFSAIPAQLAFVLHDIGDPRYLTFPQLHNITNVTRWREDGQIERAFDVSYTFSDRGYPLIARQKNLSEHNYVEVNFEYSYSCSE